MLNQKIYFDLDTTHSFYNLKDIIQLHSTNKKYHSATDTYLFIKTSVNIFGILIYFAATHFIINL